MTSDATSSAYDPILLPNAHDPQRPLLTVNLTNVTKHTASNYITWSLQIRSLLEGYDLHRFIDDTHAPPLPTVAIDDASGPNPAYTAWLRQDRLLFFVLLGSLTPALQPLVTRMTSTIDLWRTLARTYATPSRGHIHQLKDQLRRCHKGTKTIGEYMQEVKLRADALALLGKPVDERGSGRPSPCRPRGRLPSGLRCYQRSGHPYLVSRASRKAPPPRGSHPHRHRDLLSSPGHGQPHGPPQPLTLTLTV